MLNLGMRRLQRRRSPPARAIWSASGWSWATPRRELSRWLRCMSAQLRCWRVSCFKDGELSGARVN